ncbi:MAG: flagellar protein FlaG [Halopseudomonas sp.]
MVDQIGISSAPASAQPKPQATSVQGSAQSAPQAVEPESQVKQVDAAAKAEAAQGSIEQAKVSAERLQASVEKLNQFMKEGQRALAFSVDDSAEQVVVRVTDRETNELVRQIPTEEALAIREHLDSVMGMLLSEKV